ncbi:hypothetical protein F5H01DRAFT_355895 [Linnemannia elongata]|nr:hypothetical protein F5H01DRAFT_355895 [Linnemannia elongata]
MKSMIKGPQTKCSMFARPEFIVYSFISIVRLVRLLAIIPRPSYLVFVIGGCRFMPSLLVLNFCPVFTLPEVTPSPFKIIC